jgi:hypothetical protein
MKTIHLLSARAPTALIVATLLSGPAHAQQAVAPTTATPGPNIALTRDDVMRDLAAWRESGVERNWNSDNTPDINSPEYIASYRKYVDMVHPSNAVPPMQSQSTGKW